MRGTGVAPGTAVAPSWRLDRAAPHPDRDEQLDPDRVEQAFRAVADDLDQLAAEARAQGRDTAADIVAVGALIAADPGLVAAARATPSVPGVRDAIEAYAAMLEALPDETLRERAADIRQLGRRVIDRLTYTGTTGPPAPNFVLVAEEIGPADLLEHAGNGLAAAVAVRGGASSHAAILARSIGLPLVVGVDPEILDLPENTPLLVDAGAGVVVPDPAAAQVHEATVRTEQRHLILTGDRGQPHLTADGQRFELLSNVASTLEVNLAREAGAEGIGLLRTEIPFLEAARWPTGPEHRRALRPLLEAASGWPVTVRLLDFTNDKIPPFLHGRPARIVDSPEALAAQLQAIVGLAEGVHMRVMVPMVTSAADLKTVHCALPVGAMVETVAAVDEIESLCQVADFLSIGTNDLTAAVLDLDRTDPRARPELTAHPRVLAMIGRVVAAARRAGRPVSVCGDAGAHPTTLPLLLGAGVRSFSVAGALLDETRYRLRRLGTAECADAFREAAEW